MWYYDASVTISETTKGENVTLGAMRKTQGISQEKLAAIVGVRRESIARYESGTRRPSPAVAERIANALGMDISTMWTVLYSTRRIDVATDPDAASSGIRQAEESIDASRASEPSSAARRHGDCGKVLYRKEKSRG